MKYSLFRLERVFNEEGGHIDLATLRPDVPEELELFTPVLVLKMDTLPQTAKIGDEFEFVLQESDEWILQ